MVSNMGLFVKVASDKRLFMRLVDSTPTQTPMYLTPPTNPPETYIMNLSVSPTGQHAIYVSVDNTPNSTIKVDGIKCANRCASCFGISHLDCHSCVNNLSLKAGTNECICPLVGSTLDVNDLKCKCDATGQEPQNNSCGGDENKDNKGKGVLDWEITKEATEKFKAELPSVPETKKDDMILYFRVDSTLEDDQKELIKAFDFKNKLNVTNSDSGKQISSSFEIVNFGKIAIFTFSGYKLLINSGETTKLQVAFTNTTISEKNTFAEKPKN